eukprot:SAG31_NODE_3008_length_4790_cov_327.591132_4_plen_164_part_00
MVLILFFAQTIEALLESSSPAIESVVEALQQYDRFGQVEVHCRDANNCLMLGLTPKISFCFHACKVGMRVAAETLRERFAEELTNWKRMQLSKQHDQRVAEVSSQSEAVGSTQLLSNSGSAAMYSPVEEASEMPAMTRLEQVLHICCTKVNKMAAYKNVLDFI